MCNNEKLQLNVDPESIRSYEAYREVWTRIPKVVARMVEKHEKCNHKLGAEFEYGNDRDRPNGICSSLHLVLKLYLWRAALGFPSWERDNHAIYRIHCPAKKGTVWELKRRDE